MPKTKVEKQDIKKIVREDTTVSLIKVIGTALAAISVAWIVTQLTGAVNSIILAMVVSVSTVIFNEFYRIILSISALTTRRVAGLTDEEIEREENEKQEQQARLDEKIHSMKFYQRWFYYAQRYLRKNPIVRTALIFSFIVILTTTISYYISNGAEKTQNNFTTTISTNTEEISEGEKNEIISTARQQAENNTQTNIDELETANQNLRNEIVGLEDRLEESENKLRELENRLNNLKDPPTPTTENNTSETPTSDNNNTNETTPSTTPTRPRPRLIPEAP